MFVYTLKASTIKFFAVVILSVAALVTLVSVFPSNSGISSGIAAVAVKYDGVKTNDDRIAFIENFGYTVTNEPSEIVDVVIPDEFDSVYENYNSIQRAQGLNLKKYQGKKVTRYTYAVENYDYEGRVLINLLVYKNKIIGGDVCSLEGEGFIHGFEKPLK